MSYNYTDYHHRQFDHTHTQPQPNLEYPYRTGLPHSFQPPPKHVAAAWHAEGGEPSQFDHPQPPPYAYNAGSQPPPDPPDWQQRHPPLVHTGFHPPHAQPPGQLDWQQRYDPLPDLDPFDSYSQPPYAYPGQFSQPLFAACNTDMLQQSHQSYHSFDGQPKNSYEQPHHNSLRQSTSWDPPWLRQTTTYQQPPSYEPDMYSPSPPGCRPTCWDPPAYWETPGQHSFHEVSANGSPLPPASYSSWNQPAPQPPHPATAAAKPIEAMLVQLLEACKRVESRLDAIDRRIDNDAVYGSLTPMNEFISDKVVVTGPLNFGMVMIEDNKANDGGDQPMDAGDHPMESGGDAPVVSIEECSYNEKVDQIELLSAPCFNIVTLNELVTHSPPIGGFSKDDHLDEKELISEKNFFGYVEGRKMLLLEQDRDDDGQVTLNDLETAVAIKNVLRRPAKKFLTHRSTKKFLKRTRSCHDLLSVIAFDPGGKTSWLRLSLSLVVAWSQYLSGEKVVGVIVASPHKEVREAKSMVNLSELFATFANDVICIVALGRNYGEGQEFTKVTEELDKELDVLLGSFDEGKFVPWLCWIKFVNGISGKIRRVARKFNEFLEFVVREHIGERKEGEKDYVDVWLEVPRNERCGFVLDDISIKALIMDMFATGSDTAITLIEWMLSELIRHKKANNELFFMVDVFTLHQLCASREHYTFDPGGDNLPKLRLSTFFVASWFPP